MTAQMPKILHVITRLDPGGSATNTIVSADQLRKHGFDTFLAYGPTHDPDRTVRHLLDKLNIKQFLIPNLVRNPSPLKDWQAMRQLRNIIRDGHFDLIHTHTSKAGVLGRMASHACKKPSIHTPHGHIFYGYFGPILTWLFIYMERMMAKHTDKIISLTDIETSESLENGIGKTEQYVTIHSGVPLSSLTNIDAAEGTRFRRQYNIPERAFLFISIGRLVPVKGFDILINAFIKTRFTQQPVYLAIVGDGDERKRLESIASQSPVGENIRFTGSMPDIRPALSAANTFVLASRNEGMGRVFIEAMAAGIPTIGTSVGGVPSLISDGRNGILVPGENIDALSAALKRVESDRVTMKEIGRNAAKSVFPEYDQSTMVQQIADVYRTVLEKHRHI